MDPIVLIRVCVGLIVVTLYFAPSLVAYMRRHSKKEAIAVLNLLTGWTCLGWVGAIVWAHTEKNEKP